MNKTKLSSQELFNIIKPCSRKTYLAQLTDNGLGFNPTDMFSTFVKEAARCNEYNCDVIFDIEHLIERFNSYRGEEFEPVWIGFRKLGVDGTDYVLLRLEYEIPWISLTKEYFALYSVSLEHNEYEELYNVILNKYNV
jgi:hypothetical protein